MLQRIIEIGAVVIVIGGLLFLAYFGSASPVLSQERTRVPPGTECITLETTLEHLAQFFAQTGLAGVVGVETDEAGDQITTAVAPGIPTALHHRFVDGCMVEVWEGPIETPAVDRPAVKGTPA